ncbi:MAG TPA: MBL fold metallo-hydrolase [Chloroflexota bacterium]|nr:MBL fold metallo-hydrolase [Chloroflexota bacterium]
MARCTLLGTAAALPSVDRDNTALLFVGEASAVLVDCPGGAYAKLLRAGLAPARLTHLLLTHQHTDHTYGLPGLLQSLWLSGRTEPLPIVGLPEVQALVDRALAAFAPFGEREPFALPRVVLPPSASDEPVLETPDFRVWTAPSEHSVPSVAVRVEARASGAAVVYSSDTAPCAAVERLARGARLLVHEATFSASAEADAGRFAHSTAAQAGRVARAAGVAALWLVHFTPTSGITPETLRAEAAAEFAGAVAVPPDLASHEF